MPCERRVHAGEHAGDVVLRRHWPAPERVHGAAPPYYLYVVAADIVHQRRHERHVVGERRARKLSALLCYAAAHPAVERLIQRFVLYEQVWPVGGNVSEHMSASELVKAYFAIDLCKRCGRDLVCAPRALFEHGI